jgi:hypothetical protein
MRSVIVRGRSKGRQVHGDVYKALKAVGLN